MSNDAQRAKISLNVEIEGTVARIGQLPIEYEEEFLFDEKVLDMSFTVPASASDLQMDVFQSTDVATVRWVAFIAEEELSTVTVKLGGTGETAIPLKGLAVFSGDVNSFFWSNSDASNAYRVKVVGFGLYT